jgi:hypothetical protein
MFGGQTLWTPSQITTALWLDAADAATVTTVSGAVSQWNDKSGNSRNATQSTASARPTYTSAGLNGLNTVTPDGSNDYMDLPVIFSDTSNYFIIGAFRVDSIINSGNNTDNYFFAESPSSGVQYAMACQLARTASSNLAGHDDFPPSGGLLSAATATTASTSYLFAFGRSSGTREIWINGTVDATQSSAETYSGSAVTRSTLFAVRLDSTTYHCMNGKVGEIVAMAYPSQSNRERVEGYLAHRWGLTANLPAGHPYKTTPPYAAPGVDYDAQDYIARVEAADGQALETGVKDAINAFVVGCKSDGIWTAIKASCILAGARTLAGALVPLVGTAPTNNNFVSGDYNRETGLLGNGSTKYLNSNRNNNADPQNSKHLSVYASSAATSGATTYPEYIGAGSSFSGASNIGRLNNNGGLYIQVNQGSAAIVSGIGGSTGFIGVSRSNSSSIDYRAGSSTVNTSQTSQTPYSSNIAVFIDLANTTITGSNARIAFYSIGESLILSLLDSRVSTLISAYAAAIP